MSKPQFTLKPGYAYKMTEGEWGIVVVSEGVSAATRYCGTDTIDGALCAVFQHMDSEEQYDGTYYAQTKVLARNF